MDVVINYIMESFNADVEWARNLISTIQKRVQYGENILDVLKHYSIPKVFSRYF